MSYTKGPWDAYHIDDRGLWCIVLESSGVVIAPSRDNARLISAAPDLLDACKVALYGGGTIAEAAEIVRSAIAKAEGR